MLVYVLLVVLHISLGALWFGAPLMIGSVLKKSAASGQAGFAAGARVADRMALLGGIGSAGSLLTGLALIFKQYGGMKGLPAPFHIALTLVLIGVVLSFAFIKPTTRKLAAAADAADYNPADATGSIKKMSMFSGISQLLWLISLVCMYASRV